MRRIWPLRFAVTLVLLLLGVAAAGAAKDYSAERYDVDMLIEEGGHLLVKETVRVRFEGGPFTFFFREVLAGESDGFELIGATLDGQPASRGASAGQVEVEGRRDPKVTWHFSESSNTVREFQFTYRLRGALRQTSGADMFQRAVLPGDRPYVIEASTVTLRYPPGARLLAAPVPGLPAEITSGDGKVTLALRDVPKNRRLDLKASFERGSILQGPPAWQQRAAVMSEAMSAGWRTGLVALAFFLIAGSLVLFRLWRRNYRPDRSRSFPHPIAQPPAPLPPALAGALAGGKPAISNMLGTLFRLGQMEAVAITEQKRGFLGSRDFLVERTAQPSEMAPHEQLLWDVLFVGKKGSRDSIKMSQLGQELARGWKRLDAALREELALRGWWDPARHEANKRFTAAGVVVFLLGMAVMLGAIIVGAGSAQNASDPASVITLAAVVIAAGLAAFMLGIAALIAGAGMSPLSEAGMEQASAWRAFAGHIKAVSKGKARPAHPDDVEKYLPYAASFGLAEGWVKAINKAGELEIPPWFHALAGTTSPADSGAAMVAMVAATNSSASGAAGGGGGGGGGGASGAG